jgi:SAM-dependent methyltransferase
MPQNWRARALHRRAQRALVRNLVYQEGKSLGIRGHEAELIASMTITSRAVFDRLQRIKPIGAKARILEVGSGAHGLSFYFPAGRRIGVDPVAAEYVSMFPLWQRRVQTASAFGEQLPFRDASFDVVLCDNVVDHAEYPKRIIVEMARVLKPEGLLFFTVNVHHPIYHAASTLHAAWRAAGVPIEIGPFADHTVHLTVRSAPRLFDGLPFRIIESGVDIERARAAARAMVRHLGDRLKRLFFKNALYTVLAVRTAGHVPAR